MPIVKTLQYETSFLRSDSSCDFKESITLESMNVNFKAVFSVSRLFF